MIDKFENKMNRFLIDYSLIENLVSNYIKIREDLNNEDSYDNFKDSINKSDGYIYPKFDKSSFYITIQKMYNQIPLNEEEKLIKDSIIGSGFKRFFLSLLENKWRPQSSPSDLLRQRDWSAYFYNKDIEPTAKILSDGLINYRANKEKILKEYNNFSNEKQFRYKDGPVDPIKFFESFDIESNFFIVYDPYILRYGKGQKNYPLGVDLDKNKIDTREFVIIARRLLFFIDWIDHVKSNSKIEGYSPKVIFASSGSREINIEEWKKAKDIFIKKIDSYAHVDPERFNQLKSYIKNFYIISSDNAFNIKPFSRISHEFTCITDYGYTSVGSRTLNFIDWRRGWEEEREYAVLKPYQLNGDLVKRVNIFSSNFFNFNENFKERFQSIKSLILQSDLI